MMTSFHIPFVLTGLLIASSLTPALADSSDAQPEPSLAQIKATFAAAQARIRSLSYDSETEGRSLETSKGVVRRFRTSSAIAPYQRYLEVIHLPPGLDWEDDPDWERTFLVPSKLVVFWVNQRTALTSATAANPGQNPKLGSAFNDYFMECTGWWPPDETPKGRPNWSPPPPQSVHVVLNRTDLRLKRELETVGERRCAVVSTPDGLDTMWFDVNRGCALVQRYLTNANDRVHICYTNESFQEVMPGVWLPWKLSRVAHRGGTAREIPENDLLILLQSTRHISRLQVNDVPEATFTFQPPPGTGIINGDKTDVNFVTPGGTDLLDNSVRIGLKIIRLHPVADPPNSEKWPVFFSIGCLLAGAVVLTAIWLVVRATRQCVSITRNGAH